MIIENLSKKKQKLQIKENVNTLSLDGDTIKFPPFLGFVEELQKLDKTEIFAEKGFQDCVSFSNKQAPTRKLHNLH